MSFQPIISAERAHEINGVPGRYFGATVRYDAKPDCFCRQRWTSNSRPISGYGPGGQMSVEICYDDDCRNGHNSFAITAEVVIAESKRRRDIQASGCLHDDIAKVFPELAPLIRWHLMGADGPMHYEANTLYLAGDRDYNGRRADEPSAFAVGVRFGNSPVTVKTKTKRFYEWLVAAEKFNASAAPSNPAFVRFEVIAVSHVNRPGDTFDFGAKFTFRGFECKWHECPFDNLNDAQEFAAGLRLPHEFVRMPTAYSKGKARELDAARSAAVWPDATDEQLCADPEELRAALRARLPGLVAEFRADVERIGFLWTPADAAVNAE